MIALSYTYTINAAEDFSTVQVDIDKVAAWSNAVLVAFNTHKCMFTVFSPKRSPSSLILPLML